MSLLCGISFPPKLDAASVTVPIILIFELSPSRLQETGFPIKARRVIQEDVLHGPRCVVFRENRRIADSENRRTEDAIDVEGIPLSIRLPHTEIGRYGACAVHVDAENLLRARVEEDLFLRAISTRSVQNGFDAVLRNPIEDVRIVRSEEHTSELQ